jgi:opacity protein-like surface antigen
MVKKLMISVLTGALMLMFTSAAMAGINTFSINFAPGGEAEVDGFDCDLSQLQFGLTVPVNSQLEFNGELSTGELDGYYNGDTTCIKVKGDYRIFEDRKVRLDAACGFYQRSLDWPDYKINSLFAGIDCRYRLDSKLSVYTGLGIGLLSNEKSYGREGDPESLYLFHLKFNYLLSPRLGLALGYTSESFNSERLLEDNYYKGFNAGVFFRF